MTTPPKKTAKANRTRTSSRVPPVTRPSLRTKRDQVKRGIALLTAKEIDKTLSPAERTLLHGLRTELASLNGRLHASKKARGKGKRTVQGPAGGIASVVSGGAPGLGKR